MNRLFKRSIASRVTGTLLLFTFAITTIFAAIALVAAFLAEDKVIDQLLAVNARQFVHAYQHTGQARVPDSGTITVYAADQLPAALAQSIQNQWRGEFERNDQYYHFLRVEPAQDTQFVLVAEVSDLLSLAAIRGDLLTLLALGLLLSMLVALGVAYGLGRHLSRPTLSLAKDVIAQCRQHNIEVYPRAQDSELDYLANVIDSSLRQLSELLQREKDFTADVSHELRTPLTIIRNQLALAGESGFTQRDADIVKNALADIQSTVSALLALARAESQELEVFDLVGALERSLIDRQPRLNSLTFNVCPTASQRYVLGNRVLAQLVFGNLIDNAIKYSANRSLTVGFDDGWLWFANNTADNDAQYLNPAEPDGDSIGQGLYLVERLTRTMNWQLTTCAGDGEYRVCLQPGFAAEKNPP